jgi:hypothetical protein
MIYEFVLTELEGLHCNSHTTAQLKSKGIFKLYTNGPQSTQLGQHQPAEANELKKVCRQLYHETKHLSFKYNELTFTSAGEFQLDYFFAMAENIHITHAQCLRVINITCDLTAWTPRPSRFPHLPFNYVCQGVVDLFYYARYLPNITFNLSILHTSRRAHPLWSGAPAARSHFLTLYLEICAYLAVFRGAPLCALAPPLCNCPWEAWYQQMSEKHVELVGTVAGVQNVRLWPPQGRGAMFDRKEFLRECRKYEALQLLGAMTYGGIDEVMERFKRWYTHGF